VAEHPIGPFLRLGFRVTANTDNRLMSGVSVSSEVHAVARAFDFDWAEIEQLAVNGAESAFAPRAERRRLVGDVIRPAYARLRA
jgi:adenosine deaminase